MAHLDHLLPGTSVKGILPHCLITVVNVRRFGSAALEPTYKDINLERAHPTVNYDLPWSPHPIEQRFGRITEVVKPKSAGGRDGRRSRPHRF